MKVISIFSAAAAMIGLSSAAMMPAIQAPPPTAFNVARYARYRTRGKHSPSGTKLARKASNGTVGIAKLR